jgi:hypothetical protein
MDGTTHITCTLCADRHSSTGAYLRSPAGRQPRASLAWRVARLAERDIPEHLGPNGFLLTRRGLSSLGNASGVDTHRDSMAR